MNMQAANKTGKVYLVGAGPGAPDLLTLRAARLLAEADIVFYDALVNADIVALAEHAEKIAVGKRCGQHSTAQRFINKRLIDAAHSHRLIVRLKGGDPMLFGRAQEEIDALNAAGIVYEVVPGITAALAASADLGVSLTRRALSRSVTFSTPRVGAEETASDWIASVMAADTAVLYMAAAEAADIATALIARGKPARWPVAIVYDASLPTMAIRYTDLNGLTTARIKNMDDQRAVVLCMGEVYRERLNTQVAIEDTHDIGQAHFIWPFAINQRGLPK